MIKRPLCVALVLWIIIILLGYGQKEEPEKRKGDSVLVTCQVSDIAENKNSFVLYGRDIYERKTKIASGVILYFNKEKSDYSKIRVGNVIQVHCSLYSFSKPGNPGQFNESGYYKRQGIDYKGFADSVTILDSGYQYLQENLRILRKKLYRIICLYADQKDAGIVGAMLLGEKADLAEEVKQLYRENGIAHILAISGLHISLIGSGLFFVLRRFIMPMHVAAIVSATLLILYAIITGASISTIRAVIMMICMLAARFLGKHYDALNALAFSALVQLIPNPLTIFDTGFLLSYGTVFGILIFVKKFTEIIPNNPFWWKCIAGSFGIQFVTLPILLFSYYEISLYSVLANAIVLPLVSIVLTGSIVSIGVTFFSVFLGRFSFGIVHYILLFYSGVGNFFNSLPYHQIVVGAPASWQILLYYGILIVWLVFSTRKKNHVRYAILLPIALVVLCAIPVHSVEELQVTSLDVGQGDCTSIRTKSYTIMIDGGSSDVSEVAKYRIVPFLKYNGISSIDCWFLTHCDSDHISGVLEILEDEKHMGITVKNIVLPRIQKMDENYKKMIEECKRTGIQVCYMEKGNQYGVEGLQIRCLHPDYQYDWENENDYSLVLEADYKGFCGLFTGDLEEEGERAITNNCRFVTYLKVAHHGSKNSTKESFLTKTRPQIALISCGKENRYGHPHNETLERLQKTGTKVYRTDQDGAVELSVENGKHITVEKYCVP